MAFGFGQNEVGEDNRIARNIVSADVQHPGDIVECGQDMHLGTVLFHLFADFCKTVSSGLAGIFGIKNPDRFCRKCWAVGPDFTDQVTSIGEKTLRKCLFQCLTEHLIDNAAVEADGHAFFCICLQVFLYGRNTFLAHFH